MQAHSTQTNRTYKTWDDLVAGETNGYCVVVMMQSTSAKSGKPQSYARVIGPFADERLARNKAASVRRAWKRKQSPYSSPVLLSVSIELIWSDLDFSSED